MGTRTDGELVGQASTMVADRGGGDDVVGSPPRPRPLGPLLLAAAVVYAFGTGYLVWRWTWADPMPPTAQWFAPPDLDGVFGSQVGHEGISGGDPSSMTFVTRDGGRIVVETLFVTGTLPATVPPLPRRAMDDADRHARDLAFAQGEEAFERFRQEQGWDDPPPAPPERGDIHLDVEVECLRVVVSSSGTGTPSDRAIEDLEALLVERMERWLAEPPYVETCTQLWGYP